MATREPVNRGRSACGGLRQQFSVLRSLFVLSHGTTIGKRQIVQLRSMGRRGHDIVEATGQIGDSPKQPPTIFAGFQKSPSIKTRRECERIPQRRENAPGAHYDGRECQCGLPTVVDRRLVLIAPSSNSFDFCRMAFLPTRRRAAAASSRSRTRASETAPRSKRAVAGLIVAMTGAPEMFLFCSSANARLVQVFRRARSGRGADRCEREGGLRAID